MTTALVIDDNRDAADTVCRMLDLLGVKAKVAYGPREAMIISRGFTPDIVYLDIHMPGVDGFEVVSYLRRSPQFTGVPFVYITSDDQAETAMKARSTGALLIIIKPATIEQLEHTLLKAGLMV